MRFYCTIRRIVLGCVMLAITGYAGQVMLAADAGGLNRLGKMTITVQPAIDTHASSEKTDSGETLETIKKELATMKGQGIAGLVIKKPAILCPRPCCRAMNPKVAGNAQRFRSRFISSRAK